jgi:SAM-dependent methyltransferase
MTDASVSAAAAAWDQRYAATDLVWTVEPNTVAASLVANLPAGRALDVAAGEGRMALWLAGRGWKVRALDFSAVGLAKGRARAQELGANVDWQVADATTADLGAGDCDLILVLYLHLPRQDMTALLERCAEAVAPGGLLLVLGHDRENLTRGTGGPQDAALLYDTALLQPRDDFHVLRLEQVERHTPRGPAVDTLLFAQRPTVS